MTMYTSSSLILLHLFSLATISLVLRTNANLVEDVCRQTRDPSLCKTNLLLDPRASTAAPDFLAEIAIDTASYDASNTKIKIHEYLVKEQDPNRRGLFVQCENLYLDVLDAFRAAPGELTQHQYAALSQVGLRIRGDVDGCEAAFGNNSPVKGENQVIGVLADAIAVIARNLVLV